MQLNHFVHVLLFACSKCGAPIVSTRLNEERNLEATDAVEFMFRCQCGWTGQIVGARAVKHWVEPWGVRAIGVG